jgi:hypothetical protein
MNIVTIDPSLSCTAVCVNGKFFVYATTPTARNKPTTKNPDGTMKKWFTDMEPYVEAYAFFDPTDKKLPYSRREFAKLALYDKITDTIIRDIYNNLKPGQQGTIVCIEGYSYASTSNTLIDLVTFSTLLRSKLILDRRYTGVVLSPPSLKLKACLLTYPEEKFNEKGKKLPFSNHDGISGGKFTKHDMMKALLDNDRLSHDRYVNFLRNDCKDELMGKKTIPKPVEDVTDAKLMYEILYKLAQKHNYDIAKIETALVT